MQDAGVENKVDLLAAFENCEEALKKTATELPEPFKTFAAASEASGNGHAMDAQMLDKIYIGFNEIAHRYGDSKACNVHELTKEARADSGGSSLRECLESPIADTIHGIEKGA